MDCAREGGLTPDGREPPTRAKRSLGGAGLLTVRATKPGAGLVELVEDHEVEREASRAATVQCAADAVVDGPRDQPRDTGIADALRVAYQELDPATKIVRVERGKL